MSQIHQIYKTKASPNKVWEALTNPNRKFSQIYFLTLDHEINRFKIQEEEVEQIKWFDRDELLQKLRENPDNYTRSVHNLMKINS